MAQSAVVRKDKGGYWVYIRYQGERHYITTYMGQISFRDDRKLAQKSADVINSEIDKGLFRPERWKKKAKKLFTVEGYSRDWLKRIKADLSIGTHYDYSNSFRNHINPIIGHEFIEDINYKKLSDLLSKINRAPKGKRNTMATLHRMLRYAHINGDIPFVPPFPEMRGKNEIIVPEIRWLEPAEQFAIIEAIDKVHRPIFTFVMLTGCRPSEARAFRKKDIRSTHISFSVTFGRNEELKEVKGKKIMPFPLTEALKELFASMPKKFGPWQFPNPFTGRPYLHKALNRRFRKAALKANLNVKLNEFGRKSFAMQALKEIDKGIVSHLLRHQDPRMIDHYAEYQTEPLKSKLDKIQRIGLGNSIVPQVAFEIIKAIVKTCTSPDKKEAVSNSVVERKSGS